MENYTKYKLVGGRIKLKQGIVPHKCKCQQEKEDKPKRSAVQRRNRVEYFEKLLNKDETLTLEKPEEIFVVSCEDEIVIEDPLSFAKKKKSVFRNIKKKVRVYAVSFGSMNDTSSNASSHEMFNLDQESKNPNEDPDSEPECETLFLETICKMLLFYPCLENHNCC
ncbi:unnamed protein product [Euphydryas editha]|uniref:Uncharacterized protein n=1 Tax=Euphydryas editha TaxID=104508 RepID=A0AAU9TTZ1_EUPED|nr:unnamed protein product [Euphydryas editha]